MAMWKSKWDQQITNGFNTTFHINAWDLNPSIKWDQLSQFIVQIKDILWLMVPFFIKKK
jgi:hypothetical protein